MFWRWMKVLRIWNDMRVIIDRIIFGWNVPLMLPHLTNLLTQGITMSQFFFSFFFYYYYFFDNFLVLFGEFLSHLVTLPFIYCLYPNSKSKLSLFIFYTCSYQRYLFIDHFLYFLGSFFFSPCYMWSKMTLKKIV